MTPFFDQSEFFAEQLNSVLNPSRRQILFHSLVLSKDLAEVVTKGFPVHCVSLNGLVFSGILLKERNAIVFASNKNLIGIKQGQICVFSFRWQNEDCFLQAHVKESFTNKIVLQGAQVRKHTRFPVNGICQVQKPGEPFLSELLSENLRLKRTQSGQVVGKTYADPVLPFRTELEKRMDKLSHFATLSGMGKIYSKQMIFQIKEFIYDKVTNTSDPLHEVFTSDPTWDMQLLDLSLNGCSLVLDHSEGEIFNSHKNNVIAIKGLCLLQNQSFVFDMLACVKFVGQLASHEKKMRLGCQFFAPMSALFPLQAGP